MTSHRFHPTPVRAAIAVVALSASTLLGGCGTSTAERPTTTTRATTTEAPKRTSTTATVTTTPAAASGEVVKEVLGRVEHPPGAPNSVLTLIRYTIPPGAKLAPHIHPGVQMARVESGELSYTVVEGTALVRRSGGAADKKLAAPITYPLSPGETVTEFDGMVHFGENESDEPVVIIATLLTADDEDLAVPVTEPGD